MSIYDFCCSWAFLFYQWDHVFLQIFPSFYLCKIHTYTKSPSAFRKSESGSSTKSRAHFTENEWPNFDDYTIAMEENEWEENDVKEFAKLVEQSEWAWKPEKKKELETINVSMKDNWK